MKRSLVLAIVGCSWAVAVTPGVARAQSANDQSSTLETSNVPPLDANGEPLFDDTGLETSQPIQQPTSQAPSETPQLPTNIPPPPSSQQAADLKAQQAAQQQQQALATATATSSSGQWIYTQQYGWVFAPYDQQYTYVTDDVTAASMYCYRPVLGWAWLASPWVISVGPRPYWGTWGPYRYSYYAHPWFRVRPRVGTVHYYGRPNYRYHAAPAPRAQYYRAPVAGWHTRGGSWHGGARAGGHAGRGGGRGHR